MAAAVTAVAKVVAARAAGGGDGSGEGGGGEGGGGDGGGGDMDGAVDDGAKDLMISKSTHRRGNGVSMAKYSAHRQPAVACANDGGQLGSGCGWGTHARGEAIGARTSSTYASERSKMRNRSNGMILCHQGDGRIGAQASKRRVLCAVLWRCDCTQLQMG